MSTETPTTIETVDQASIVAELREVAATLLDQGYRVHYFPENSRITGVRWLIVERDDNAATIEHDTYEGYKVLFPIKPSREYGSGLLVWGGPDDYAYAMGGIFDAARVATGDTFANDFANPGHPLPNDGMAHFAWAADRLVQVVATDAKAV